jgi:hypothetical protein
MMACLKTKSLKLKHIVYVSFGADVLANKENDSWRLLGVELQIGREVAG